MIAVDHWAGSAEHHADARMAAVAAKSYAQFLANLWPHRHRLAPLRTDTITGMSQVATLGLTPDLVYVDAAHDTDSVLADLAAAATLFPKAQLVGDDWNWLTVRAAVEQFADANHRRIELEETAWAFIRP